MQLSIEADGKQIADYPAAGSGCVDIDEKCTTGRWVNWLVWVLGMDYEWAEHIAVKIPEGTAELRIRDRNLY